MYDDHFYCEYEECGHHCRDCWCFDTSPENYEEETAKEFRCPGGPGHGMDSIK